MNTLAKRRTRDMLRHGRRAPRDMTREQAAAVIFREQTFAAVWHWLGKLGLPTDDRRDLSQEVFLAAHQSFSRYDPKISRPERWLNQIAVHVASHYKDRARHRRETQADDDLFSGLIDEQPLAHDALEAEAAAFEVAVAMNDLPDHLCAVLSAYDLQDVSMAAIAECHEIPLSTAYKWHARARAEVHESVAWLRRREAMRA